VLVALTALCMAQPGSPAAARLSAQGPEKASLARALDDLNSAIASLRAEARDQNVGFSAMRSVTWLRNQTNAWIPRSLDDGREMRLSIERMTRAMRSAPDLEKKTTLLQQISDDLEDKVEFCRREGLTSRRRVNVVTKREGLTEVKGLQVLYLEKFLESDPKATPQQFRGFSSPAADELVPGRYVFWAKEPGRNGKSAERKDGRVSVDSPQGPIEVLAP